MTTPQKRWIHSSQAAESPVGGMTWPWHSGQSGQPMPDPVLRTMTPITTMMKVETTAMSAIFWKRDMHRGVYRGDAGPDSAGTGDIGGHRHPGVSWRRCTPTPILRVRRAALLGGAALLSALLVACGGASAPSAPPSTPFHYAGWPIAGQVSANGNIMPLIVNAETVVGEPTRFLYSFADPAAPNTPLAAAAVQTRVSFFDLARDPATPVTTVRGTFLDSGNGQGLYHVPVTFDAEGDWGMQLDVALPAGVVGARAIFSVLPYGSTPAIGAPAPASVTPTATTPAGIAAISTDPSPDPDFYRTSIADSITSGMPTYVVFSTPKFCTSRTCGPTLDIVKDVAAGYAGRVNFIHVEPYQLQGDGQGLEPVLDAKGQLQVVQAAIDYGLPTEPYQFLIDASGHIAAKFEGIASADEIRAALDAVLAPPASPGSS